MIMLTQAELGRGDMDRAMEEEITPVLWGLGASTNRGKFSD